MTRTLEHLSTFCLFAAIFVVASSPLEAGEPTRLTEVEGITEYSYPNGLRVLLFPDRSKKTVTVNVTYFVGSLHEGRGEKGMAHLLEHMLFKGTDEHDDIWSLLEDHGGTFNGTTSMDRTNYFETLPTTVPGNLEFALKMEADRMLNSKIAASDLEKEFTVVRNEFEMGENNPVGILIERMLSTAYIWHSYGDSTIGSKSDIERVPVSKLRDFYKKYYQPDNAMLVVTGDFEEENALALVTRYFGGLPRPDRVLDDAYTVEPTQDGSRHVELRRVGDVASCGVIYHICAGAHPDFAALSVLNQIMTDEPSGRLYESLVKAGMASFVMGLPMGLREPGIAGFGGQATQAGSIDDMLAKLIEVVEAPGQPPFTGEEVERAKTRLLKNIDLSFKNANRIGVELSEWASQGDWRLLFIHRDRIEKVTPEDVTRVARHYFKPDNRTSGTFHPTKEPNRTIIPETPDISSLVKNYQGRTKLSEGEAFGADLADIERRVSRTNLDNGMSLALLPKETRGDSVRARITLRFGSKEAIVGKEAAVGMIPEMLMRGTKNQSYQAIRDELDRLKSRVSMGGGGGLGGSSPGSMTISIQSDRVNLAKVMELVGEILKQPAFPETEFEIIRKQGLAELESQLSNPQALALLGMIRRMNPFPKDSIHYVPTIGEEIERLQAVQLADLRDFHLNYYGANHGQMTVVGDFDPSETLEAANRIFGTWNCGRPFHRIETEYRAVQASHEVIQTPDKMMAMVGAATTFQLRDDDPDYPAMQLANYIFGSSAKSRLLNRLRQSEGISYSAFSFMDAEPLDRNAVLGAGAICAPQNAEKAMASLMDEFRRLVKEEIPEKELAEAKAAYAKQINGQLASDGFVTRILNDGLYLGRTTDFHQQRYDQIERLTPASVQAALKRHLRLDDLITVLAGDLEEQGSTPP